jgi:hypothetical protein
MISVINASNPSLSIFFLSLDLFRETLPKARELFQGSVIKLIIYKHITLHP